MASFDCRGRVRVSLPEEKDGSLTPRHADIVIDHTEDHVPYCSVSLPDDVKKIVSKGVEKRWNMTQVWHAVQAVHPTQAFSQDSVYHFWHNQVRAAWVRDADEMRSAEKILEEAALPDRVGPYALDRININMPKGLSGFAFAVPVILEKWGSRIREVALDSAWGTNHTGYEVYALLGEAYGSGLPIGYLFLKATGESAPHSKQNVLEAFLLHFREKKSIKPIVTLSDKDWTEINAFRTIFPDAKHQLCLWHCIKAVKSRLAILWRQPAHYSAEEAKAEFAFIDRNFLPLAQQPVTLPDIPVTKRPVAHITVRHSMTQPATVADTPVTPTHGQAPMLAVVVPASQPVSWPPRIVLRIAGKTIALSQPQNRSPLNISGEVDDEDDEDNDDDGKNSSVDDDDGNGASMGGGGTGDLAEGEDGGDLFKRIEDVIKDSVHNVDDEDVPEWLLEAGETKSKNPQYQFCPAPHRSAVLCLFIQHFFKHPIFPARLGMPEASAAIRRTAVMEMYMHCKRNGLTELSRLRTTMTVENHWKQLKHHYLHFLHRPRLDQVIYLISTALVPDFMSYAHRLEDGHRLGRARILTPAQKRFKKAWKAKKKAIVSGRIYQTDVLLWQCNCGAQAGDSYHLCKHLVQAVHEPPASFFAEVGAWTDFDVGSVTDGDDHEGLGGLDMLRSGKAGPKGGGWIDIVAGTAWTNHAKRKRGSEVADDGDDEDDAQQVVSRVKTSGSREGGTPEEEEEREEHTALKGQLLALAMAMEQGARVIRGQVPHGNLTWMRGIRSTLGDKWESRLTTVLDDIRHHEKNGHAATWPRNTEERRAMESD
ncbi:hypothetical protein FRB90_001762 [Tulasnella sp. 427]|nr:hypothetical protein FRB90_001762 [Tulasnella sp. 427]